MSASNQPFSAKDQEMLERIARTYRRPGRLRAWWRCEWQNVRVFLGLSPDWSNPENAPPSLDTQAAPHAYVEKEGLACCPLCGGGKRHPVHKV